MRIIAGAWKGRNLQAPKGSSTRPTADRARQAMFDMLVHAPWAPQGWLRGARVLDGFAGTGALGLEALSRGAAEAVFFESDLATLKCLRANIAACGAGSRARMGGSDVLRPGPGVPQTLIFLDPPYGKGLVQRSVNALRAEGWLLPGCVVVAEISAEEPFPLERVVVAGVLLARRVHGAAQILIWRD
jgi:16S rRNA (guanine966-N2)-methyltransferase